MKREENLWQRLTREGAASGGLYPGCPLVEILGNCRVLIEGHRGVREYTPDRIRVGVRMGCVEITGSELKMRCMTREQLVIVGCIHTVTMTRRDTK